VRSNIEPGDSEQVIKGKVSTISYKTELQNYLGVNQLLPKRKSSALGNLKKAGGEIHSKA